MENNQQGQKSNKMWLILFLLSAGLNVYLWMNKESQVTTLEGRVDEATREIREREGVDGVHLYGYCMGGTLALAYAALRPEGVKTFTAMAAGLDSSIRARTRQGAHACLKVTTIPYFP